MDKPASMSIKDWLIKKMAIKMVIPEKVIDVVITHQFDSANDALNVNNSVELSGFGKFYFNKKKAVAHYNKLLAIKSAYERMLADQSITEKKRHSTELRMISVLNDIKILKPKVSTNGSGENI